MKQKILFIDRDGTLINEPKNDYKINNVDKLALEPYVIPSLIKIQNHSFTLIIITNQDDLGTKIFPEEEFYKPHNLMMQIFTSQGIIFSEVLICPHNKNIKCKCRKPNTGLVNHWIQNNNIDKKNSYVIGDRNTDMQLADNIGIKGLLYDKNKYNWPTICKTLTQHNRSAKISRITKETEIQVEISLDKENKIHINTGINFFNHMLEQIATHGKFSIKITVKKNDLHIDDHHTVEDTGITVGMALKQALGDKKGIERFGFVLPMDDSLAHCILDISGRAYLKYKAKYNFQKIGDLSTEMIEHFFRSLSNAMECNIHLKVKGKNDHHKAESLFKAFGKTIYQAKQINSTIIPSSKGVL